MKEHVGACVIDVSWYRMFKYICARNFEGFWCENSDTVMTLYVNLSLLNTSYGNKTHFHSTLYFKTNSNKLAVYIILEVIKINLKQSFLPATDTCWTICVYRDYMNEGIGRWLHPHLIFMN